MPASSRRHAYGPHPEQHAELWLPSRPSDSTGGDDLGWPVVVLIHGGFWRARYRADLMHPLAADLTAAGMAVWNIEYRRVGSNGGDPLATLGDVRTAIDAVADLGDDRLDPSRVAFVGHSAGGHLALWAAGESRLRPVLVIGQAAVSDLVRAAAERLGDGATQDFLGGEPHQVPDRYRTAAPILDPDLMLLVHGTADDTVPVAFSADARSLDGRPIPHAIVDHADHMDVIDPTTRIWAVQRAALDGALGSATGS